MIVGVHLNLGYFSEGRFRLKKDAEPISFEKAGEKQRMQHGAWVFDEGELHISTDLKCKGYFYPIHEAVLRPNHLTTSVQGHCFLMAYDVDLWAGEKHSWSCRCLWEET